MATRWPCTWAPRWWRGPIHCFYTNAYASMGSSDVSAAFHCMSRSPSAIQCLRGPMNRTDYHTWTPIEDKTSFNLIFPHACEKFANSCQESELSRSLLEMGLSFPSVCHCGDALCARPPKSVHLQGLSSVFFVGPITYFSSEFPVLWRLKLIFGFWLGFRKDWHQ